MMTCNHDLPFILMSHYNECKIIEEDMMIFFKNFAYQLFLFSFNKTEKNGFRTFAVVIKPFSMQTHCYWLLTEELEHT